MTFKTSAMAAAPFKRRLALGGMAGSLALLATGCAHTARGGLVVSHARGSTTLAGTPRRVAVYDLGALDLLQALGVDVVAVPGARMPKHLAAYDAARYAKVGTLFEPDLAALKAAQPDLIICGGRSASKFEALSAVAPTIDLSTSTQSFVASVTGNLLMLGRIFDRQAQAAAKAEELLVATRGLQAKAQKAGKGMLLFVAGQGIAPQVAQTRFGILYELIGIQPAVVAADLPPARPRAAPQPAPAAGSPEAAAAEAARRQEAAQREAQLATLLDKVKPDWLFVLDRNAATGGQAQAPELLSANAAIQRTPAWTRKRVVHLDAPSWYLVGGGYTVLQDTITQVATAFEQLG
jgi:iron complex transport system substrate-binding protein